MVSSKPVCLEPDDIADFALVRALRLEIPEYPRWRSLALSLSIHAAFALTLDLAALPDAPQIEPRKVGEVVTQLFVPSPSMSKPPVRAPELFSERLDVATPDTSAVSVSAVAVDLSSIQLSFPADVRNQLPAVVAAQGGVLALLDKENPAIARYIFRPPGWRAEETTMDVTGRLRLLMNPPEKWPVFREIAARNGLDLDAFQACAVFDISYRRCLQSAIRGQVPAAFSGRVAAARLAFNADRRCGVEVLDVSLLAAPQSTKQ
jgi:hypothetical protein